MVNLIAVKIEELGDVIANRRYTVSNIESPHEIVVAIGRPRMFPDSTDFFTPYQIRGIGDEKIRYAGGIDAVQSLQLSMTMIGADLYAHSELLKEKLIWEGDENGDLGFPPGKF
jgi:hypothetical protein